MSVQEIPYWFTKLTEKPRLLATVTDGVSVGDFELYLWREISKPENLAKFPEVAKLIEVCEPWIFESDRIDEALKPFKKEGEVKE